MIPGDEFFARLRRHTGNRAAQALYLAQGTIEIDVRLEPVVSRDVTAAGLSAADAPLYTRTWIHPVGIPRAVGHRKGGANTNPPAHHNALTPAAA